MQDILKPRYYKKHIDQYQYNVVASIYIALAR